MFYTRRAEPAEKALNFSYNTFREPCLSSETFPEPAQGQSPADPCLRMVPLFVSLQEGRSMERSSKFSPEANMHREAWQVFWVAFVVLTAAPSPLWAEWECPKGRTVPAGPCCGTTTAPAGFQPAFISAHQQRHRECTAVLGV